MKVFRYVAFVLVPTKNVWQDFRITPYINYACVHCLKKTKDRTILSSELSESCVILTLELLVLLLLFIELNPVKEGAFIIGGRAWGFRGEGHPKKTGRVQLPH